MKQQIATISLLHLSIMSVPVLMVIALYHYWSMKPLSVLYANGRMLLQLILVGYVLAFIFDSDSPVIVLATLTIMLCAAGWIALRPIEARSKKLFLLALGSIAGGGVVVLALVTQAVLQVTPWYSPHTVIPLAGMIFTSSMNAVSLAAERLDSELRREVDYPTARNQAFRAALIPITNSLLAVGLVSLPGMMTGQILSGVDPLIAARYQIVVMTMVFSSSGFSAAGYLVLAKRYSTA